MKVLKLESKRLCDMFDLHSWAQKGIDLDDRMLVTVYVGDNFNMLVADSKYL